MNYSDFRTFITSKGFSENSAFLLEKISNDCGFFAFNRHLCFVIKSGKSKKQSVSTNYVDFVPETEINSIDNDPSFERGKYDFLILKEQEDEELIESFIKLCDLYGKNPSMAFDEFISSIIDLFQLPRKQNYLDCIGFLGELIVLYSFYDKKINLSSYWHLSGPFSKYDISLKTLNIEVKSSTSNSTTFKIKHSQLFNNENNFVALVSLRKTESSGFCLEQMVHFFKNTVPFSSNLKFQIALEKELQKQIEPDMFKLHFELNGLFFFEANKLQTITGIPLNISEISYDYDFDLSDSIDLSEFILNFMKD